MHNKHGRNYLRDMQPEQKNIKARGSFKEYARAFLDYLGRPKTIFDFKDRGRLLLLMFVIIIILQKVVQILADWYN